MAMLPHRDGKRQRHVTRPTLFTRQNLPFAAEKKKDWAPAFHLLEARPSYVGGMESPGHSGMHAFFVEVLL